jgi:hypothetical protein
MPIGSAGAAERNGLMAVARAYRELAAAASRAAGTMKSMRDLPAAPHDASRLDRPQLLHWMRAKIEMQTELAELLIRHADLSKKVLGAMEADAAR